MITVAEATASSVINAIVIAVTPTMKQRHSSSPHWSRLSCLAASIQENAVATITIIIMLKLARIVNWTSSFFSHCIMHEVTEHDNHQSQRHCSSPSSPIVFTRQIEILRGVTTNPPAVRKTRLVTIIIITVGIQRAPPRLSCLPPPISTAMIDYLPRFIIHHQLYGRSLSCSSHHRPLPSADVTSFYSIPHSRASKPETTQGSVPRQQKQHPAFAVAAATAAQAVVAVSAQLREKYQQLRQQPSVPTAAGKAAIATTRRHASSSLLPLAATSMGGVEQSPPRR